MDKLLFSTVGWNIAETTRMIEIAKAFKNKYQCEFMSYGGEFEPLITEEGFILHKMTPRETPKKIEHLWKIDRGEKFAQPWTLKEVEERVKGEVALFSKLKPKAVFLGFTLTLPISTQVAKVPLISVMPSVLSRPYINAGLPIFPFMPNWINRGSRILINKIPFLSRNMRIVAKKYNVKPPQTLFDVWEGDVNILTDIPELSLLKKLPKDWHFSGPIYAHLNVQIPSNILKIIHESKQPLMYFAMGSSANKKTLAKALKMLEGLDVTIIAPIQSHVNANTRIPSNVHVTDWLPAPQVVPLMDIAFTHGGQGTVQTNVASGVPFVGIGMQPEQTLNIYTFEQLGSAIMLHPKKFKKHHVHQAVHRLLYESSFKEKAQQFKTLYENHPGVPKVFDIVTSYLNSNQWPKRRKL